MSVLGRGFIEVLEWRLEQEDQIETKMVEDEFGSGAASAINDLATKPSNEPLVWMTWQLQCERQKGPYAWPPPKAVVSC